MVPSPELDLKRFGTAKDNAALPGHLFSLAGVQLDLSSDDSGLPQEFANVFGGLDGPVGSSVARVRAQVCAAGPGRFGSLWMDADLADPAAFLLGFASPTVPMIALPSDDPAVKLVGVEGEQEPLFVFRGQDCQFLKIARWRRIVSHVLFLVMLRRRSDLLFFHAASVGVGGKGVLLVGPKGSGKSTISLALAARGHHFLGDETAAYHSATGTLLPMRRPAGVKPGIRARNVALAIDRVRPEADEDGILRIGIDRMFPNLEGENVALGAVVFLRGFGPEIRFEPITPGREELSMIQPLRSTTFETNTTQKVFEMIRLLGSVECYQLIAADPDETARVLEERVSNGSHS